MTAPRGSIWDRGLNVLTSAVESATGAITAFLGDAFEGDRDTDGAEWWQHVGFVSRAPKPTKGRRGSPQVIVLRGARDAVIASSDERGRELAKGLAYGETAVYAAGEDGTITSRIVLKADGSMSLVNDAGHGITIDSTGVHIHAGGATLDLAAASGVAKLDGTVVSLGTGVLPALRGPTGILGAPSAKVVVE